MARYFLWMAFVAASNLYAQNLIPQNLPHPFAFGGLESMGGGYAPWAWIAGGGLRMDTAHYIVEIDGSYDNGHKVNDNDQPNPKGHDRGWRSMAYYRFGSEWFLGGGAWGTKLYTTNYTKQSTHPSFGGGRDLFLNDCATEDCRGRFTMRLGLDWVMTGSDWQNGTHGALFTVYMPSPSVKGHIFLRETAGIYRIHDTVTDRSNRELTLGQMSIKHWNTFAEFTIMYRF